MVNRWANCDPFSPFCNAERAPSRSFNSFVRRNLTLGGCAADAGFVQELINYQQLIPTYRRDTDDITGAVRMIAIEMVGMEQMPGGRFQIIVRTAGAEYYATTVLPNIHVGREALEIFRARLGGEEPMFPVPNFMPATGVAEEPLSDPAEATWEANNEGVCTMFDPGVEGPLFFRARRTCRRTRRRHGYAPGRDVRALRTYKASKLQLVGV